MILKNARLLKFDNFEWFLGIVKLIGFEISDKYPNGNILQYPCDRVLLIRLLFG